MPGRVHTLTVSASYDARQRVAGIGIVIQECQGGRGRGPIIAQISETRHDAASVEVAILRAFELASESGYTHIQVRSDGNAVRKHLKRRHRDQTPTVNPIHTRILELARQLVSVSFAYVPRRKNQIARKLARAARLADAAYLMAVQARARSEPHDPSLYQPFPEDDEYALDDESDDDDIPF